MKNSRSYLFTEGAIRGSASCLSFSADDLVIIFELVIVFHFSLPLDVICQKMQALLEGKF